jgi:hypothetical protein
MVRVQIVSPAVADVVAVLQRREPVPGKNSPGKGGFVESRLFERWISG